MSISIEFNECSDLQKLGWVALYEQQKRSILVRHGSGVERFENGIVEGVWDDNFEKHNFHLKENFFGSGLIVEDDTVYFVPSSALVDRIVYCISEDKIIVSNSLINLLSITGARLDPKHDYTNETLSILKGTKNYDKHYRVKHPEIKNFNQLFRFPMKVKDNKITTYNKYSDRKIDSYSDYISLIRDALKRISENMNSGNRRCDITPYTTISSGYDSSAVSALVKNIGVDVCFTASHSNSIIPKYLFPSRTADSGEKVANLLGYNVLQLHDVNVNDDELYFLAASSAGPELKFYSMARYIAESDKLGVVFTGYHGDVLWDKKTEINKNAAEIYRGDTSGFNLCEIRLHSGFFNVAVPFMFSQCVNSMIEINNSKEMTPWKLNNDYDRPIARRIVEENNIPRSYFGYSKKGVTRYYSYPKNENLRKDFIKHIQAQEHKSYFYIKMYEILIHYPVIFIMGILYMVGLKHLIDKNKRHGLRFSRFMFVWAANNLAERYSKPLKE